MTNQMPSPAGAPAPAQAVGNSEPVLSVPSPEKKAPEVKVQQGIQVRALRDGWSGNRRRKPGDVFFVSSLDKVGTWVKCLDAKAEAEAQKLHKAKKAKAEAK